MEGVQQALGEHQDSVLTRARLRELAASTDSTEAAFLFGRLHALEEAHAEHFRHRFEDAWKAAGRTSLHSLDAVTGRLLAVRARAWLHPRRQEGSRTTSAVTRPAPSSRDGAGLS
jgi:hypothetical protein